MTDRSIGQEDGDTYDDADVNGEDFLNGVNVEDLKELNVQLKAQPDDQYGVQRLQNGDSHGRFSADRGVSFNSVLPSDVPRVNPADITAGDNVGQLTSTHHDVQHMARNQRIVRNGGRGTGNDFVLELNRPRKRNSVGGNVGHGKAADSNSAPGI